MKTNFSLTALLVLCICTMVMAQNGAPPDTGKKYFTAFTDTPPVIDGKTDDAAWKLVQPASDFTMARPIEGGKPTYRTEFRILYDNTALYVSADMFDNYPDSIYRELGLRDGVDPYSGMFGSDLNADMFRFVLDPYNNRQDAYDFGVYASGVQADSKFSDYTWDGVWQSAVFIHDKGWSVEIKIPYSAIRFSNSENPLWSFQITRNIRRSREFIQWCLTPSTAYNAQLYWGTLQGLKNIKPPVRLSLTPYLSSYIDRAPVFEDDGTFAYGNTFSWNAGADIKYGLDERFTLDMTLLPDFGQTQSDNKIKTLGYEEINYDENRYFFKEGTELFDKNGLFYSRRIGRIPAGFFSIQDELQEGEKIKDNPSQAKLLNATKISGRNASGMGIGFFNAVTDNMYATIKQADGGERKVLTDPLTNYNVIVFDQQIKNSSNVYLINASTIRAKDYDDSNVSGTGFTFANNSNSYAVDANMILSQYFTKSDDRPHTYTNELGYRYFAGIRKISGKLRGGISRSGVSPSYFQRDLGYYINPNRINYNFYAEAYQFQPKGFIREGNIGIRSYYTTTYDNPDRTAFQISYNAFANLLSYNAIFTGAGFTPVTSHEYDPRINGRYVKTERYWYAYFGISSDYRKRLAVDAEFNISNFIDNYVSEGYNNSLALRFRVNDKFTLNYKTVYNFDPYNFGFAGYDGDEYLYGLRRLDTYINSFSAKYIFKNDMYVTVAARHYWLTGKYRRYFYLQDDGSVSDTPGPGTGNDFSFNAFNIDFIYSWRFAPGSIMTIAYKNAIEYDGPFETHSYSKNLESTFDLPQLNSFSVKVVYYLDYASLKKKLPM